MTIANQTNRTSVVGDGTNQDIPFSFPISATSDIEVRSRVITTGVESDPLTESSDYTVVIDGDIGGTVTMITTFASTYQIHVKRNTPMTQSLDLEQGGSFNAENIEDALDKNTKLSIENSDSLDRTLRFPETDADSIIQELPKASTRAGKYLYFGTSDGNPSVAENIDTGETTISAYGKTLIDDASASAALTTLGFSAYGKTLIDDTDAAAARGTLGLDTDDDVEFAELTSTDIITKSPWVDVRAYGAVGNGSTDDTTAIQAAIDVGGVIFFPAGVYIISDILGYATYVLDISNSDTQLIGEAGAWLKLKDGDYSGKASFFMLYSPENVDRITISNLGFDGNRANVTSPTANSATVYLYRTDKSKILNCIIKNPYGGSSGLNSGFCIIDTSTNFIVSNNFIYCDSYDNSFGSCGGIFVQGHRGVIDNNILENLNDAAIIVNGTSTKFTISGNILTGNAGNIGIENGPSNVAIFGNEINDTRGYGIATIWIGTPGVDATGVSVTGNVISGNLGTEVTAPISISRCDNFSVVGNTIKGISIDNAQNVLISISNAEKGLVVGNMCQGGTVGMRTSNVVKVLISDNVIESTYGTYDGMQLTNVNTDVSILNNSIFSGNNGIVAVGGWTRTRVSVRGNHIQATTEYSGITPEQIVNAPVALANEATPSVIGGDIWLTGGTTTITDFDDGVTGQVITIIAEHSLDITDGTNIFLSGSTTWTMTATDTLTLIQKADGKWYETSRSDSGA